MQEKVNKLINLIKSGVDKKYLDETDIDLLITGLLMTLNYKRERGKYRK